MLLALEFYQRIDLIRRITNLLPLQAEVTSYSTLIFPLFDYGNIVARGGGGVIVVQFCFWFNVDFLLFDIHYNILA